MNRVLCMVVLVVALSAAACGDAGGGDAVLEPPQEAPFLTGTIVSVQVPEEDTAGSVHVRGESESQGGETEIVARVDDQVPLARRTDGGVEPVELSDMSEGDAVTLWVSGPVMESFPLQGAASYVLLEESG